MIAKLTGKVPAKHGASIQRRRGEGKPRQDVLRWPRASKTAGSQVSVEYSRVTVWSHRRCPHQGAPGDERAGPQHGLQAGAPVGPRHERLSPAEGLLCRCGWSRAPLFCSWGTGPGDRDPGRTRGPPCVRGLSSVGPPAEDRAASRRGEEQARRASTSLGPRVAGSGSTKLAPSSDNPRAPAGDSLTVAAVPTDPRPRPRPRCLRLSLWASPGRPLWAGRHEAGRRVGRCGAGAGARPPVVCGPSGGGAVRGEAVRRARGSSWPPSPTSTPRRPQSPHAKDPAPPCGRVRGLMGLQPPGGVWTAWARRTGLPRTRARLCVRSALEPPGVPGEATPQMRSQQRLAGERAGREYVRSGGPQRKARGWVGDGRSRSDPDSRPHASGMSRAGRPPRGRPLTTALGMSHQHVPPRDPGSEQSATSAARELRGRDTPRAPGGDPS